MSDKLDGKSADVEQLNIEKLKSVFPECVNLEPNGKFHVDTDKLLSLLGNYIDDEFEKYSFTWKGKSECLKIAQKRSSATLLPCKEESVDFENTQNLYIEGDNLEVLKLIQKSYFGKVKMIYIDPPYNTGNDFVYKDDYKDPLGKYKRVTNQENKSNAETQGRFHTNWLNMMYPRLRLAANLLSDDGVIFISIGDEELANLEKICDEIFGEISAVFVWKSRSKPTNAGDAKFRPQKVIEYIVMITKNEKHKFNLNVSEGAYSYPNEDEYGKYRTTTILTSNLGSYQRETMRFQVGDYTPPADKRWKAGYDTIKELLDNHRLLFTADGNPMEKVYEYDDDSVLNPLYTLIDSNISGTAESGKTELNRIVGKGHGFDTVKPSSLIKYLINITTNKEDTVLDFFSGTATTADAIMQINAEDAGNRKYILIQLPVLCDEKSTFKNVCEIGKERIRRAGKQINEHLISEGKPAIDTGFKVFKLDTSNIISWDETVITENNISDLKDRLSKQVKNLKAERSDPDLVYEIMIKMGFELTDPIETIMVNDKKLYSVSDDNIKMLICLAQGLVPEDIDKIAELKPNKIVIAESSFFDNSTLSNAHYIFKNRGIELNLI